MKILLTLIQLFSIVFYIISAVIVTQRLSKLAV